MEPQINISASRRDNRGPFNTPRGDLRGRSATGEPPSHAISPTSDPSISVNSANLPAKHNPLLGKLRESKYAFRNAIVLFGIAQIFVVWVVVTSMVYLQDYALKGPKLLTLNSSQSNCNDGAVGEARILEKHCDTENVKLIFRPKSCQTKKLKSPEFVSKNFPKRNSTDLPLLIFFAGVEGSGHKFFEQVFRRLPVNFSVVAFEPELHLTYDEGQKNYEPKKTKDYSQCYKLSYAKPLNEFAEKIQLHFQELGNGPYVRARDSYPLGRVRTPLARPDLVNMIHLDGVLYRLKVVVLLRDLAKTVRSASRMGYHGGDVGVQVRIVEDSMSHLDTVVRMLSCDQYIVVNFDWIAEDFKLKDQSSEHPLQAASSAFANFLGMNITAEDMMTAVKGARETKPKHNATTPLFGEMPLDEFFGLRQEMWPLLAAAKKVPYFWPSKPDDWPSSAL